jgi:hypothetical protein
LISGFLRRFFFLPFPSAWSCPCPLRAAWDDRLCLFFFDVRCFAFASASSAWPSRAATPPSAPPGQEPDDGPTIPWLVHHRSRQFIEVVVVHAWSPF